MKFSRRALLAGASSIALAAQCSDASARFPRGSGALSSSWQDVLIGGGGYQRGLDINPDGTMVSQTDVFGAYVGSAIVGTVWQQLITKTSMPSSYSTSADPYQYGGVIAIKTAPSNSSVIYMSYGPANFLADSRVLVSQNKGVTWTDANFGNYQTDPNNGIYPQSCQPRFAIDPLNPAICFVGTELEGLWFTTNGLSATPTWTQISANSFPTTTTNPGVTSMQFDPTSGSGGVTQRLIVGVAGSGLWVTANAGTTWTKISGSPTNPGIGSIGSDGTYYCTQSDTLKVWRLSTANVLTDITPDSQGYCNIVIDPNNPARGVAGRSGGFLNLCTSAINSGTPTWAGTNFTHALNAGAGQPGWVQASNDFYLSDGTMLFDPLVTTSSTSHAIGTGSFTFTVSAGLNIVAGDLMRCSQTGTPANFILGTVASYIGTSLTISETANGGSGTIAAWTISKERIWFSMGTGVLYTDGIVTSGTQEWWAQFAGMENLVANQVIWPPGGNPFLVCWDRPFWNLVNPNSYQAGYHPAYVPSGQPVIFGSSADWAKSNPSPPFIAGIANDQSAPYYSGFSTDGGVTWTPFTTAPPTGPGGANGGAGTIAVIDTQRFVIARNNNGGIYQTQNQGVSWTVGTNAPTSGFGGNGFNTSSYRVAADCVNIGTVYAFNDGGGGNSGVWISTDGGQTWSQSWAGTITGDSGYLPQLKTVPNLGSTSTAGHLFLTGGQSADLGSSHPQNVPFYRWTNGGSGAPAAVSNVLEVITFGFGAPKPGNSYPAIYIVGWVTQNGGISYQYGVWRSDDDAVTWNELIDFPPRLNIDPSGGGWLDGVTTIEGNPNVWNECIVGFQGSSVVRFGPAAGY